MTEHSKYVRFDWAIKRILRLRQMLRDMGYLNIEVKTDGQGKERMVRAKAGASVPAYV